jgi:hypothetical protein
MLLDLLMKCRLYWRCFSCAQCTDECLYYTPRLTREDSLIIISVWYSKGCYKIRRLSIKSWMDQKISDTPDIILIFCPKTIKLSSNHWSHIKMIQQSIEYLLVDYGYIRWVSDALCSLKWLFFGCDHVCLKGVMRDYQLIFGSNGLHGVCSM